MPVIQDQELPVETVREPEAPGEIPARFRPSRLVLLVDRFMTQFINVGGVLIVIAVFGIFFFILYQIIPLFKSAQVKPGLTFQLPLAKYQALGLDEWGELPVAVRDDGAL